MSRREPRAERPEPRGGGLRASLHRFFTSWVADDPEPDYSSFDRADGLGAEPDPMTTPRNQLPESDEVLTHSRADRDDSSEHASHQFRR
jgi:hypothetical protein